MKTIELDVYHTDMTVAQATEKGKEFVEAIDASRMINMLIFKQTDGMTGKQIAFVIGEVRRFCNGLEAEMLQQRRDELSGKQMEQEGK